MASALIVLPEPSTQIRGPLRATHARTARWACTMKIWAPRRVLHVKTARPARSVSTVELFRSRRALHARKERRAAVLGPERKRRANLAGKASTPISQRRPRIANRARAGRTPTKSMHLIKKRAAYAARVSTARR